MKKINRTNNFIINVIDHEFPTYRIKRTEYGRITDFSSRLNVIYDI